MAFYTESQWELQASFDSTACGYRPRPPSVPTTR
jgi:hypothetical protein